MKRPNPFMHVFVFTTGPLAGVEFATFDGTPEEGRELAAEWVASEPALSGAAWEPAPAGGVLP